MQRWYLGRNKTRSWSIPTAASDSPGLWEGIWENRKLKSKSLRLTQGACAQQRFDTSLCPRQPHHCPILPIRGAPCSQLPQRVYQDTYCVHLGPSLGQRGVFQAAAWGRSSSWSSVLFGSIAKSHTLPGEQARTEEGAHLLLLCPQPLGTRFPALSTQQLPGSGELV